MPSSSPPRRRNSALPADPSIPPSPAQQQSQLLDVGSRECITTTESSACGRKSSASFRLTEAPCSLRVDPSYHKEFSSVWLRLLAFAFGELRTNNHLFDSLVFQELLNFTGEKDLDGAFRQPLLKNHDDDKSTPRICHIELDFFVHRQALPLTAGARPEVSILHPLR
jgi:hypothetical protein